MISVTGRRLCVLWYENTKALRNSKMIIMVTGATAGFGESITRRFVANGHKVIATGRREERLKTLKDDLGDNLYIAQLDVRNRAAIETLIADLPAEWQAIDVLVNNAGLALGLEPAHRASVEDWEDMIDTNNKGLVYMTRASCRVWWSAIAGISLTSAPRQVAGLMPGQRLWGDQSLRPSVQSESTHRPARHRRARHRHRAGSGGWHRVFQRPL